MGTVGSPTCVLVDVGSGIEVLPTGTSPYDALEQGPFHSVHLAAGWTLHWSSSSYQLMEVNEVATSLAKETVKGDACLVHQSCGQEHLDTLLQSRPWQMAQPIRQPGTPRASSSQSRQEIDWHMPESQSARDDSRSSSGGGDDSINFSGHVLLKRTRSLQHIAAANSTRQRILRSMTAATTSSDEPYCTTPPQQCYAHARSSSKGSCGLPPIQVGRHQAVDSVHVTPCSSSSNNNNNITSSASTTEQPQRCKDNTMHHIIPFYPSNGQHTPTGRVAYEPAGWLAPAGAKQPGNNSTRLSSLSQRCCTAMSSSSSSSVPCGAAEHPNASHCGVAAAQLGQPHFCASNIAQQQPPQLVQSAVGLLQQQRQELESDVVMDQCDQQDGGDAEMHDVDAGYAVPQCTATGSASCYPAWGELSEDVIGRIAGLMGPALSAIMPVYLACRSWRRAVLEDDQLLLKLSFQLNVARPFKPTSAHNWQAVARQRHPALLLRASKLGNVSALVSRARLLDAACCPEEAMRCWRRAAKFGHVEGQLAYGLGLYRGIAGLVQDAEDAHLWLMKAVKQVQKPEAATSASSSGSSCEGCPPSTTAEAATADSRSAGTTATAAVACKDTAAKESCSVGVGNSLSPAELAAVTDRVLAQAGLVLGYLAFDGEGTIKVDRQEAVRYFRMSAGAGCKEAEQVLGWIYSTGQYG